ncbi:ubiquitin carboxyl-terminal hydrolase 4-like [Anolis carolinensis]|uniref:ubiquitin carboxyl-terminal hydrolase 4-like n=1 Tax=Anolis carolinensis TaxID=28377 RepID=UPI002F2B35D1
MATKRQEKITMSEMMIKYQLEMKKLVMEERERERQFQAQERERKFQAELKKMEIEWERQRLTLSQPSVVTQPGTPSDLALKSFSKYTKEDVEMQRTELAPLLKMSLCPGDSWCLIDYKWFKKWQRYVGFESWDLYYAGKPDYYPGPIDNAKLFEDSETQTLKKYCMDKVDYEVIPIEAWNKLVNWYGCTEGQRPIERKVVEYGKYFKYCRVEVYPSELKPSQNNDSTDHISSYFDPVEDSAEDGGIVNLQKKLSESQLEIHCVAEVNESQVVEIPVQCHSDTGVGQAEVMEDLEVPAIDEDDLLEHSKEMNVGIRSQKLEEDGSCSGQTLQSSTTKGRSLDAQSSTDSICSVVTSLVTTSMEHGQQLWPGKNLPQETTKFDPVELLCTGEPKGPTNTPKKMDILSLRVIANHNELRSKWILVFNGENSEDFNAAEIHSFNYHQFTSKVLRKYMNYVSQDFLNDSWKFRKRLFGAERVHCVAGKDECGCPQQHVNLWNAPQSETSTNCIK